MMTFGELEIGDWFNDASDHFMEEIVFIKIAEDSAICLNHGCDDPDFFKADWEVTYCPSFTVTFDECTNDHIFVPKFKNFDAVTKKYHHITKYNEIPMHCIYKGRGQTYYKRLTNEISIVFWSLNQSTLGKIFSRMDWDTHIGNYYICDEGIFNCSEQKIDFPCTERDIF